MAFLNTPDDSPLYEAHQARLGYLPNYAKVFAFAPDAYAAWQALSAATQAGLGKRRYELATVRAAQVIGSRYCTLAHSAVLRDEFLDAQTVRAILSDSVRADLDPAEHAIIDFAAKIAADPTCATQADIDALRQHGLSDREIFHIVLAVTIRLFFAGTLAAAGAQPDPQLEESAAALLPERTLAG